jgi:hypothetical protein
VLGSLIASSFVLIRIRGGVHKLGPRDLSPIVAVVVPPVAARRFSGFVETLVW